MNISKLKEQQTKLEEIIDDLEDTIILQKSLEGLKNSNLISAENVYKNLNL